MTAESPLYNTTLERFTLDSSTSTQVYCRWREINTCGSVRSKRAVLSRFQSMFRVCFISAPDTLSRFAITSRTSFWRFCDVTSRRCHLGAIYSRLNCVDFLLHWEIFEQGCRGVFVDKSFSKCFWQTILLKSVVNLERSAYFFLSSVLTFYKSFRTVLALSNAHGSFTW